VQGDHHCIANLVVEFLRALDFNKFERVHVRLVSIDTFAFKGKGGGPVVFIRAGDPFAFGDTLLS
jgi:hypothetical protein